MSSFFNTNLEFVKGIGSLRAALLEKELGLKTILDLLHFYPFRYEDRSRFYKIKDLNGEMPGVQIRGKIRTVQTIGGGRKKRFVAYLADDTGDIELVWFKGVEWIMKKVVPGIEYVVFGKPSRFGKKLNIAHPEIELASQFENSLEAQLQPVYSSTEKLRKKYLDSKALAKIIKGFLPRALEHVFEFLPKELISQYGLTDYRNALKNIHFPGSPNELSKALYRLKFDEFFFIQLKLLKLKTDRTQKYPGDVYQNASLLTQFYNDHLPFDLTNAQKRVIKEIYADMKGGVQMNRLLQGDVGSGKTIVAFICTLLVISDQAQAVLMAPTEILATQHYTGLKDFADKMGIRIALLTGSTKNSDKKKIRAMLADGDINIIVGTHALIEDKVKFKRLGLAIVDEQHRFGVEQRSKLWNKNEGNFPHVLVMTATPIPRTLAMTVYGDLDVSIIDELPAGRKPIKTIHRYDSHRLKVNQFIRDEVKKGRQVYVVYPLIEESEKSDLKDLTDGYESMCRAFPDLPLSIVHGRMSAEAKEFEMSRFVKGETKIMVATTVIEVGVNVPNASVMIIENAERFGLAQLHQLRGRVGRGAEQSYCILMTKFELSKEARVRIETMVRTNNGFEIADVDLKLRGPGDLSGTQQSGVVDLQLADISKDGQILQIARESSTLKKALLDARNNAIKWSSIS